MSFLTQSHQVFILNTYRKLKLLKACKIFNFTLPVLPHYLRIHTTYIATGTEFPLTSKLLRVLASEWPMRGMTTLLQGKQELLVVRDKIGRAQVSLG